MNRARTRLIAPLVSIPFLLLPVAATPTDTTPPDRAAIVHVLNRITFGPRPGDVEMVQKMGLDAYLQQQLHPETIDDSALDKELTQFPMIQMSAQQLAELYRDEKKDKREAKKEKKAEALAANPPASAPATNAAPAMASADATPVTTADDTTAQPELNAKGKPRKNRGDKMAKADDDDWKSSAAIEQIEEAKLVRAVDSQRQLQEVLADFWNNHFNVDVKKKTCRIYKIPDDRDAIRPHILGKFRDLLEASAKSPAMLYYLDNATNTVAKDGSSEPDAVPDADTTASTTAPMMQQAAEVTSPAMQTVAATTPKKAKKKKAGGINENYAREVMELHTLGIDGGYTQNDVQEVARCFTGWSVDKKTGAFVFHADQHDNGAKIVLGHKIPANGGMQDGETVLDLLASSPATAHHIAFELCQRFVSDNPPDALVTRIAGVFTQTGGDLRQVTAAILTSPEFLSPADYGTKIKSPLEFSVSAVRASGATFLAVDNSRKERKFDAIEGQGIRGKEKDTDKIDAEDKQTLNWHIADMGEPLFACTPPTGYKEDSTVWVSPGALIERLNFAMALTQQKLSDIQFSPAAILAGTDLDKPDAVLQQCVASLLQNNIGPGTRKVLDQTALPAPGDGKTVDPTKLIALIIGSPEFQRK